MSTSITAAPAIRWPAPLLSSSGSGCTGRKGRNGVLVYAAIADRKLAVIGDLEIHRRVGDPYWQEVVDGMTRHLAGERPRDGFVHAIGELGSVLSSHFPRRPDDRDELSNRVSVE